MTSFIDKIKQGLNQEVASSPLKTALDSTREKVKKVISSKAAKEVAFGAKAALGLINRKDLIGAAGTIKDYAYAAKTNRKTKKMQKELDEKQGRKKLLRMLEKMETKTYKKAEKIEGPYKEDGTF